MKKLNRKAIQALLEIAGGSRYVGYSVEWDLRRDGLVKRKSSQDSTPLLTAAGKKEVARLRCYGCLQPLGEKYDNKNPRRRLATKVAFGPIEVSVCSSDRGGSMVTCVRMALHETKRKRLCLNCGEKGQWPVCLRCKERMDSGLTEPEDSKWREVGVPNMLPRWYETRDIMIGGDAGFDRKEELEDRLNGLLRRMVMLQPERTRQTTGRGHDYGVNAKSELHGSNGAQHSAQEMLLTDEQYEAMKDFSAMLEVLHMATYQAGQESGRRWLKELADGEEGPDQAKRREWEMVERTGRDAAKAQKKLQERLEEGVL